MTIKELLSDPDGQITKIERWEAKRQDIVVRLFATLGPPPVPRETRGIKTLEEEKLSTYLRRKICYTVGEGDVVAAYLLIPNTIEQPAPAIVAMHQYIKYGILYRTFLGLMSSEQSS
jgi:hypothetical protein